ncbi:NAD(P)H dehydrogenase [Pedobacter hiemivivus]|uniref:FMN dependent NADH:quinone oxidoreductase n=1 Tax=Pedobacter hiemivivus TaxID=2530454 RepID=A0A4U1GHK9_9SPHI|nr:NAD(P)H-dependent oxidoreductase [Pedobacter hiemivivus]TKC63681.1 NAD(P)H dehydrogenase [Pedobacter hiemivivus]
MKKILVINASANTKNSVSRSLSDTFIEYWKMTGFAHQIQYRDFSESEISHIDQMWIDANLKSPENRSENEREMLKWSDIYIKELHDADIIVLASPMYNWSIPSTLKAYIDNIMRFNETFTKNLQRGDQPYRGLLENKSLILLLSRGSQGYEKGERNAHMNFQSSYLKMVFGIMGIHDVDELAINGTSRESSDLTEEILNVREQLRTLINQKLSLS